MINVLYAIIIFPVEQIIEIVYTLVYKIFDTASLSVIGVSFAVTFFCLPLYIVAEKWQETERAVTQKLAPKTKEIKQVFKGDEQYMILSTYYRQNHYHPVYALRNSFGILIQVPFFIAAYHFLSHLEGLKGASFLFINDLSKPDSLISIGSLKVNVLPILMTFINIISGIVYAKGLELKDKIQLYGIAFVFLVLLYNSQAGLVLYWTMNNILSLCKNIFYRLKNPLKILYLLMCGFTLSGIVYLLFINDGMLKKRIMLSVVVSLVLFIPLFLKLIKLLRKSFLLSLEYDNKKRNFLFLASAALLAVLLGFSIPASVIVSSPEEFSFVDSYNSPLPFIFNTLFKSCGLFLFWPACIYFLFNKKIKSILAVIFSILSTFALANCFIFTGNYSTISNIFLFDSLNGLSVTKTLLAVNIFCAVIIFILCIFIIRHNKTVILNTAAGIITASLFVFSLWNIYAIQRRFENIAALKTSGGEDFRSIEPIFSFSKNNPNIIVIMADKAINGYVKPIFDEHSELYEQFDGFTLFPNTLSFAKHTLTGVPPVWGGYEYTPKEMNARASMPLVEKHNEALLLIPTLLTKQGYQLTVTDPSWANYDNVNDTSIYNHLDNVKALNTIGRYTSLWYALNNWTLEPFTSKKINRNALWFSFLKIAPPFLRKLIYDDGWYWGSDEYVDSINKFLNSYAVIDFLPSLTRYDAQKPSAVLFTNETTHEWIMLQVPEYKLIEHITNTGNGEFSSDGLYHANNAFYLKIGEWFDELKKNDVYDNMRIIIVSDHGTNLDANISGQDIDIPDERREGYNPVLLFKDFNAHGKLKIDKTFMTNADVPVLTLNGIAELVNPFTKKDLTENPKDNGVFITINHLPQAYQHNKNTFKIKDDEWVFVKDNIFDAENWVKLK